ncbi:three component ABC system middle component [Anoxybacteroides rupiense]|uniref:three component ABC system middle component n=1 Tax=Anoxybacteroides rupiense TaxID=311460 RepID=UPI0016061137|nr:three component ABC system middle component [Anoxybacillus rupiensis]MBB3907314.1 hypothetical protein [Anoxybacillus rupiensis]
MVRSHSIYNNELIGSIAILAVLEKLESLSVSKVFLILPLVFHKNTVDFLKKKNTVIRGMEEFVIKKPEYFTNFNERYFSLLLVSLNSLILLIELKLIRIEKEKVYLLDKDILEDYKSYDLGKRAEDIIKSSEKIAILLQDKAENLYLQLRVEI